MKGLLTLFVALIFLLQVPSVLAQTPMGTGIIRPRNVNPASEEVRSLVRQRLNEIQEDREQRLSQLQEQRELAQQEMEQKRAEFSEKLGEIKDQRKQALLERMDGKIQKLNENWTNHATRTLERLEQILAKIETRTDRLEESSGADVTGVRTAITAAESAIADAQALVDAQAGEVYVIEITEEDNLGSSVSSTISTVRTDIQEMMEAVRDARAAVLNALKELVSTVKTTEPTATPVSTPES